MKVVSNNEESIASMQRGFPQVVMQMKQCAVRVGGHNLSPSTLGSIVSKAVLNRAVCEPKSSSFRK